MGRRTVKAHKLWFNKLREPDNLLCPIDINGESLLSLVERWAEDLKSEGAIEVCSETYVTVQDVRRFNGNILIIEAMSGKSGEPGVVRDLEGVADDIPIGENQAPLSSCRAAILCPNNGQMALWFSEYSSRSSGARHLLTLLQRRWTSLETGAKFNKRRVVMSEALLESGKITEIEVTFTRRCADLADGIASMTGMFSHVFKPDRKNPLSSRLLGIFKKNPAKAYEYVEIAEKDVGEREVFVSVDVGGHKRKINVSDPDDGLYFHEELNGPGEPPLSDAELTGYCCEEAVPLFERSGYYWDDAWSKKDER